MAALAPERTTAQHQSVLHFVGQGAGSDEEVLAKMRIGQPRIAALLELRHPDRISIVAYLSGRETMDFATTRTHLMKSSATGLKVRFFNVKIATGLV